MTRPDFSGEWILNRQGSTLSPRADAVQSGFLHIHHREPTFRCKGAFVMPGNPFQYEYELLSDGRDIAGNHDGAEIVSRLGWDGDALVVAWTTRRPHGEEKISFRYELAGAHQLHATEQVRGTDHDQDNVWVFDRA